MRKMSPRKGMPYVSIALFADELVLERCVRGQVRRRAPHWVIGRIKRDLGYARGCLSVIIISQSTIGARTALDWFQLPSCGKLPTTKTFYPRRLAPPFL